MHFQQSWSLCNDGEGGSPRGLEAFREKTEDPRREGGRLPSGSRLRHSLLQGRSQRWRPHRGVSSPLEQPQLSAPSAQTQVQTWPGAQTRTEMRVPRVLFPWSAPTGTATPIRPREPPHTGHLLPAPKMKGQGERSP